MSSFDGTSWVCLCQCDCGKSYACPPWRLTGTTQIRSCGCLRDERARAARTKHGGTLRGRKTPEYRAWCKMLERCYDSASKDYAYCGGRGIAVCPRWRESFAAFREDLGMRPSPQHRLERLDRTRGYEPGNVAWRSPQERRASLRRHRPLTARGITKTCEEWAREIGVSTFAIDWRLSRGWSVERAVTTPKIPPPSKRRS